MKPKRIFNVIPVKYEDSRLEEVLPNVFNVYLDIKSMNSEEIELLVQQNQRHFNRLIHTEGPLDTMFPVNYGDGKLEIQSDGTRTFYVPVGSKSPDQAYAKMVRLYEIIEALNALDIPRATITEDLKNAINKKRIN